MKSELNLESTYILIYILASIIFIKTIINFFIENTYPTLQNLKTKDKLLIRNLEDIKTYLDIPYLIIIFYLVFNIKLNIGIKLLFLFSLISTALNYLVDKRYIYKFINKKYINENIINFLDIKVDYALDIIILIMYLYVMYNS
jgi:hypothetical protein